VEAESHQWFRWSNRLLKSSTWTCTLLYQKKDKLRLFLKANWMNLRKSFGARFKLEYVLIKTGFSWSGLKGRCDKNMVRDFWHESGWYKAIIYIMWPWRFMKTVEDFFKGLRQLIKHKLWLRFTVPCMTGGRPHWGRRCWNSWRRGFNRRSNEKGGPETLRLLLTAILSLSPLKRYDDIRNSSWAGYSPPYSCMVVRAWRVWQKWNLV